MANAIFNANKCKVMHFGRLKSK